MKILQINSVCGIGSTGRIATDIDAKLRENNIEGYIAYGRDTSIYSDHILKIGTKIDYYIHGGLSRLFDTHALWGSRRATKQFIKRLKDINPDVIHLHNLHGYYLNLPILFKYLRETGKPVVMTLHDCWAFTGHCSHFSYVQCDKWKKECSNCPQKKAYPASSFLDNSYRNYNIKKRLFLSLKNMVIVTPSQWLANLVQQSFLSKYPVKVIHNGVDTKLFKPVDSGMVRNKYSLRDKFVILGVASTWGQRKGLKYFIELSKIIDDKCVILLVGLNDQQIAELPQNIIGIKRTANINELAQLYSAADVFINPTLEDNFPTVNLEALACGTPVITFKTGGSPEAIVDGCGYVAEVGSINTIKKYLNQVRKDGKAFYTEQCIKRVKDRFDKNDCFEDYIELFKQLVK
jgi:putative colanic acid biosynthesis glycosyltransferase